MVRSLGLDGVLEIDSCGLDEKKSHDTGFGCTAYFREKPSVRNCLCKHCLRVY